jgi:eukaryotic-like serine/threonine-protein kinase
MTSRSGRYQLWTKDVESGREAALDATPEAREGRLNADGSVITYGVGAAFTRKSLYTVSLTGGIADKLCDDCAAYWHLSSDRRYVVSVRAGDGDRASIEVLDLESGKRTVIVADDRFHVYEPRFSPDDHWLEFHARTSPDRTQIFVVPFAGGMPVQRSQWIAVTAGEAWEDAIKWSVDGNRLYFFSERDGYRCIYAQDLDGAPKHPVGKAFAVFHSHHARLSLLNLTWGYGQYLAVSRDRMVFGQGELTANIWMTRRVVSQ